MKITITGSTGMLGHVVLRKFAQMTGVRVTGIIRNEKDNLLFPSHLREFTKVVPDIVHSFPTWLESEKPNVLINCAGVVKQSAVSADIEQLFRINAVFPRQLAVFCANQGIQLIHISTDCVFSGKKGSYTERDLPDPVDAYGESKLVGEQLDGKSITLRTSIIGHELKHQHGLLEWFLAQQNQVTGFANAVFSGLTTDELASLIIKIVTEKRLSAGLYNVAAKPISKYDLLALINDVYRRSTAIGKDSTTVIDRSLDASKLRAAINYIPPEWPAMINSMYEFASAGNANE
jgi:dTDP-4-dehydrorhamnose reductase